MRLRWWQPWWRDLSDYYGVDPIKALALGTRAKGRRPWGLTLEEIWAMNPRRTEAEVQAFYRDVGPWFVYRQAVRHRRTRFPEIRRRLRPGAWLLEYGCGIAPVSFWLAGKNLPGGLNVVLTDVDSEHFDFGRWRLGRRLEERRRRWSVDCRLIRPGWPLPLTNGEFFDVITILEVFEHLPNPLAVAEHLVAHLAPGGHLFEDFFIHADADGSGPDLPQAQVERPAVYKFLRKNLQLVAGRPPDAPEGGGTREWRR